MDPEPRAKRDDLAALRIDREAAPPRRRWVGVAVTLALVALALGGALLAWRLTLGRTPSVRVAYARLSDPGAAVAGEVLTGSGYVVTGDRYISLGVRVPSRIEAFLVEEGQKVTAGQPLVQLDARQYEAALREAQADLARGRADAELQRKQLARTRQLVRRDVASQADLDVQASRSRVAEAEVARLEAEVARQAVDLEDTVLRAPTNGVILEKLKEVGEIAVPGGFAGSGELVRMANLDDLRAELDVNEADLARVELGQAARVTPDAYPERRYAASVVKLYPQINRQKGTLKVEVGILEPDEWLKPDMSVRIAFFAEAAPAGAARALVLAPRAAVREEGGASFAWVVSEGRLVRRALELSGTSGDAAVVSQGLSGGEALVVGEASELREGQAVEVLDDAE